MSKARDASTRRRALLSAVFVTALVSLAPESRAQDAAAASPFRIDLDAGLRHGPASGFVQIPRGGAEGTTTSRKPTLSQMGIDRVTAEDAQLEAGYDGPGVYAGARIVRLTGSSVLGNPLESQGTAFPAGSAVRGYLKLDGYRFGGQWSFPGPRPTTEYPFTVRPGIGALLLFQSYQLHAMTGETANRAFSTGAPQIMVDGEGMAIGPLSFSGRFSSTLPFPKLPWVVTAELRARLRIFGDDPQGGGLTLLGSGSQGGFLYAGVAYDRIESNDLQKTVPNHIRASMGPLFVGGVEFRY